MSEQESILDSYRIILNVIDLKAKNTHAVMCAETGRVLCFTNWMQTAKQMESELNVKVWYYISKAKIIPRGINLNLPFRYVFDLVTGSLVKAPTSEEDISRFIIYSEKSAVYDIIHRTINQERDHIRANLSLQELIYKKKHEEALRVLDSTGDVPDDIPYLQMHCSLTGDDMHKAAAKIVDKHNFVESRIMETEMLRMKYTHKLRSCSDLVSINLLLDEFNRESSIYGRF